MGFDINQKHQKKYIYIYIYVCVCVCVCACVFKFELHKDRINIVWWLPIII